MHKGRMEAFSDGVIAIILTIMVLELKIPHGIHFTDLESLIPIFVSYVLSFIYIGIYWNNHHHLCQAITGVNGLVLWANLHLLFWLSLVPFATAWMGENHFEAEPVALYGLILFFAAVAYYILTRALLRHHGDKSKLAIALGRDIKGKVSLLFYAGAVGFSFLNAWVSVSIYGLVALIWLVPDRRIERTISHS